MSYMLENILINIIQIPRELFAPFDLGGFVVPCVLPKVSEWRKQIILLLLNVPVVLCDNNTLYPNVADHVGRKVAIQEWPTSFSFMVHYHTESKCLLNHLLSKG